MSKVLSHEDIAQRFVEAKVIDFSAMGKFIAEMGPSLAVNNLGWHGVQFGRFNILACMLPPADVERLVGNLGAASLTATALQQAAAASK